jgi:hypothetical protein
VLWLVLRFRWSILYRIGVQKAVYSGTYFGESSDDDWERSMEQHSI